MTKLLCSLSRIICPSTLELGCVPNTSRALSQSPRLNCTNGVEAELNSGEKHTSLIQNNNTLILHH